MNVRNHDSKFSHKNSLINSSLNLNTFNFSILNLKMLELDR